MLSAIPVLSLVLAMSGQFDHQAAANRFLEQCRDGKFQEATASFDDRMKNVLGPEKLEEIWKKLGAQVGELEKFGPPRIDRVGESTRVKIRCDFKAMPLDALVSFNPNDQIEGFFLTPAEKEKDEAPASEPPYVDTSKFQDEPLTVGAPDWPLPATLSRPNGVESPPLVILVHGSGPHDRDETIGPNHPFRDLAHGLASRGIAVLRFEKRTFAHKQKLAADEAALEKITVEEEVVADVLATIAKARTLSGINHDRIFVLGHSLGGTLAPAIAQRDGKLAGIILLAASNRPPEVLLSEQLAYVATVDADQAEATHKLRKEVEEGFAKLNAGQALDSEKILGVPVAYWKSWKALEPAKTAASLTNLPVLVLQGGRDYQVTEADYRAFHEALQGRPHALFRLYSDLNHLFQKGEGKAIPGEYLKPRPVDDRVIHDIADWVNSLRA